MGEDPTVPALVTPTLKPGSRDPPPGTGHGDKGTTAVESHSRLYPQPGPSGKLGPLCTPSPHLSPPDAPAPHPLLLGPRSPALDGVGRAPKTHLDKGLQRRLGLGRPLQPQAHGGEAVGTPPPLLQGPAD